MTVTEVVARQVRELRDGRGWSARELADRLAKAGAPQVSRSVLASIESGRRPYVTVDELFALARVFNVSPLRLLLPWSTDPNTTVDIGGITGVAVREIWEWALGAGPLTVSAEDPDGDLQRFRLDSLPHWARSQERRLGVVEALYRRAMRGWNKEAENVQKLIEVAERRVHVDEAEALEDEIHEILRDREFEEAQKRMVRDYTVATPEQFREFLRQHDPERLAEWDRDHAPETSTEGEADE